MGVWSEKFTQNDNREFKKDRTAGGFSRTLDPLRILDTFGADPLADMGRGVDGPPKPKPPPPPEDETKILVREMARAQTERSLRERRPMNPNAGGRP
jgi:hypothetical protein